MSNTQTSSEESDRDRNIEQATNTQLSTKGHDMITRSKSRIFKPKAYAKDTNTDIPETYKKATATTTG